MEDQFFEKSLEAAREAVTETHGSLEPRAELFALITVVSGDKSDIYALNNCVAHARGEFRSRAAATVVRTLARCRRFQQAREFLHSIRRDDAFWRAHALARLGFYSGHADDFRLARLYADAIQDDDRQKDANHEIDTLQHGTEKVVREDDLVSLLNELVAELLRGGHKKSAHCLTTGSAASI